MRLLLAQEVDPASQGSVERAALYVVGSYRCCTAFLHRLGIDATDMPAAVVVGRWKISV